MVPVRRAAAADFAPELQLLLACGRGRQEQAQGAEIEQLLRCKLDWDAVVAYARWHGLVPLTAVRLEPFSALVPTAARQRFRRMYTQALQHNLRLATYLHEILACLEQRGIRAAPFKGPWLARRLYGNVALRQSADLDLLLRREEVIPAIAAVRAIGFAPGSPIGDGQLHALTQADFELWLQRDTTHLELHWECIPRFYGIRFGLDEAWPRLRRVVLDGVATNELAPEDLFLALVLHGSKHLWGKLIWVLDLVRLVQSDPGFNWPQVLAQARALGATRLLLVSTRAASELFGLAVPELVRREWESRPETGRLASRVYANLSNAEPQVEGLRNYWFFLLARDSWSDRLRQLLRHAFTPGPGEWSARQRRLPAIFYLPMHLWRLTRRLASSAGQLATARLLRVRPARPSLPEVVQPRGEK